MIACSAALRVKPSTPLFAGASQDAQGGKGEGGAEERNARLAVYAVAVAVAVGGLAYASVPLYKVFCQATGYGGTTQRADEEKFKSMKAVEGGRTLTVNFSADVSAAMPWTFKPQQKRVRVVPGETALAFYTAHNPTERPVTGVSTYNITPMKAGVYFNKIQCFCFEEQRLRPHEEIDMPVFFYVDPAFLDDPAMDSVSSLTLSYTFFPVQDRAGEEATWTGTEGLEGPSERIKRWTAEVSDRTGIGAAAVASKGAQ
jgi:cytochrome c oxidase assembly protein subunit 11